MKTLPKLFPFFSFLAGALLFLLCSCSPGGDPALIGKWQAKDGTESMEIRPNGTWVDSEKDAEITGARWEWTDTNHIRLTVSHKLVGKASGIMKVTLKGDTLILQDEDGATEYTRVK
jgi:hypothetical protein